MIVQHPAFKSVTHDVDNPEDWVAQGWVQLEASDPPVVPDEADDTDETPRDEDSFDE